MQVSPVGTPATADETLLHSFSLPGGTLGSDGDLVKVSSWGQTHLSSMNFKTVSFYIGGVAIFIFNPGTVNRGWDFHVSFIRVDASNQLVVLEPGWYGPQSLAVLFDTPNPLVTPIFTSYDTSSPIEIKVTGTSSQEDNPGTVGDVVEYVFRVVKG